MTRLCVLVLLSLLIVPSIFAGDVEIVKSDHLAIYLLKQTDSGDLTYKLQDKVLSLESIIGILGRISKLDNNQLLEIIASDNVQVKELTIVLMALSKAGWRKVRFNGLIDGELSTRVWRAQAIIPVSK